MKRLIEDEFEFSFNVINILKEKNINTVEDLINMTTENVKKMFFMKEFYFKEIFDRVHEKGLKFKDEDKFRIFSDYYREKIDEDEQIVEHVYEFGTILVASNYSDGERTYDYSKLSDSKEDSVIESVLNDLEFKFDFNVVVDEIFNTYLKYEDEIVYKILFSNFDYLLSCSDLNDLKVKIEDIVLTEFKNKIFENNDFGESVEELCFDNYEISNKDDVFSNNEEYVNLMKLFDDILKFIELEIKEIKAENRNLDKLKQLEEISLDIKSKKDRIKEDLLFVINNMLNPGDDERLNSPFGECFIYFWENKLDKLIEKTVLDNMLKSKKVKTLDQMYEDLSLDQKDRLIESYFLLVDNFLDENKIKLYSYFCSMLYVNENKENYTSEEIEKFIIKKIEDLMKQIGDDDSLFDEWDDLFKGEEYEEFSDVMEEILEKNDDFISIEKLFESMPIDFREVLANEINENKNILSSDLGLVSEIIELCGKYCLNEYREKYDINDILEYIAEFYYEYADVEVKVGRGK